MKYIPHMKYVFIWLHACLRFLSMNPMIYVVWCWPKPKEMRVRERTTWCTYRPLNACRFSFWFHFFTCCVCIHVQERKAHFHYCSSFKRLVYGCLQWIDGRQYSIFHFNCTDPFPHRTDGKLLDGIENKIVVWFDPPFTYFRAGSMYEKLSEFLKLQPSSYSGLEDYEDTQEFLDEIQKISASLGCSSNWIMKLATFELKGKTNAWWMTKRTGRPLGSSSIAWNEFKGAFINRFLLQSMRLVRAHEFELFKQGPNMS